MKNTKKTMSDRILKVTAKVTEQELTRSANTASCILMHQPKAPKTLKSLRKF